MSCAPARGYARCDACYTLAVVLLAGLFSDSGSRDRDMGFPDAAVKAPSAWVHSAEVSRVPGREGEAIPAGTVLYKVLWVGFPPEIATWEEEDDIPCGEQDFVAEYEAGLADEEPEELEEPEEEP